MNRSKYLTLISIVLLIFVFLIYIKLSETKIFIYKSNVLNSRDVIFNFKENTVSSGDIDFYLSTCNYTAYCITLNGKALFVIDDKKLAKGQKWRFDNTEFYVQDILNEYYLIHCKNNAENYFFLFKKRQGVIAYKPYKGSWHFVRGKYGMLAY
ncbi:hypothetical protein [Alkanindiges illinoisensis]|uniref:Uncharacterized protein n=1 Tax=Alkanindiges illinoisensis TaxID=197183 RepID=A0A4Y7XDQ2_9GAMM|nr:hypothetical protein [Alkanindiges illinoisensis]TEU29324.1 hypothetical protein E2B99_04505 [Alkanindiges illinoisensis]